MIHESLQRRRQLGACGGQVGQFVHDERPPPSKLGGLAAQSPEQGAPVRILRLGEPGERGRQRFGEVTALHRRRRLVGHGVDPPGLPDPLDEQAGLADAPAPPDQPKPAAFRLAQREEPLHLRSTIQKLHIVIMPIGIILSRIMLSHALKLVSLSTMRSTARSSKSTGASDPALIRFHGP